MNLKSITILLLLSSLVISAKTGYASWYGEKYQGKPTASGEPFDMYAYTAANRTLPFGTIIKVTNLKNNKSVQVRINDRGPTKKSRIVDLSYKPAKDIGIVKDGVVPVKIETLSISTQKNNAIERYNPYLIDKNINSIKVQISAFSSRKNAKSFIARQRDSGYTMKIIEIKRANKILYKVVIVCNSSKVASRIINSKRYKGAYIFKK